MKIVVLDGGCYSFQSQNGNKIVRYNSSSYNSKNETSSMNHGSAVTKIIDNYVQESTIISVQVFNDNHMIRARDLASSIKKSINEFHPDIINISMGTRNDSDGELQQAVNYAVKKKVVLVCAADNSGAISYPAFYKDTLSVLCDYKIKQIKNFNVVYYGKRKAKCF